MHCSSPSREGTSVRRHRGQRRLGDGELAAPGVMAGFTPGVGVPASRGAGAAPTTISDRVRAFRSAGMRDLPFGRQSDRLLEMTSEFPLRNENGPHLNGGQRGGRGGRVAREPRDRARQEFARHEPRANLGSSGKRLPTPADSGGQDEPGHRRRRHFFKCQGCAR